MYHYEVFGACLRTEIEFPELRAMTPVPETPRWTFRLCPALEPMQDAVLLGEEPIYRDVVARLYRHRDGLRIRVADTGAFDLSTDGTDIRWEPTADPWWDFGRGHLLGRVLATSMHVQGTLTLHGSAVATADGIVAFLAPKFTGKSTLAMHLGRAGAPLVTDDTLPVRNGPLPLAFPGVHTIRLRTATEGEGAVVSTGRDGKFRLTDIPVDRRITTARPLAALYLLRSIGLSSDLPEAARAPLDGIRATLLLLAHTKIGQMLGATYQLDLFREMAALARHVPVYELSIQRDHALLPGVVARILAWHGGPGTVEEPTPGTP